MEFQREYRVLTRDGRTYGSFDTKAECEPYREPGATLYVRALGLHGWEARGEWA